MSTSSCVATPLWLSGAQRPCLYSYSVYSCHIFSIFSASIRFLLFLFWRYPYISPITWRDLWSFPFCSFPLFLCIVQLWRPSYFLLLPGFKWVHLSLSPLPFVPLLSSAICKASSDNHFAFLHFSFLGIILVTTSCIMLETSVHGSSGTLSTRSNSLNLFVTSTVWSEGSWFSSYLNGLAVFLLSSI